MSRFASKVTVCGRVHFGPVCVNGSERRRPMCMACGREVTREDRELVQRMWNQVRDMLDPIRKRYERDRQ